MHSRILRNLYYNLHMKESESEAAQSCPTLCDPMNYRLAGSFVLGIFQTGIGVGCHFLLQGIFPTQGLNPASHITGTFTVRATRDFTHGVVNDIAQLCCLVEFTVWAVVPCGNIMLNA